MGIKQLMSIIKDEAPDAVKEGEIKNQFGRKVAIVSTLFDFTWLDLTLLELTSFYCHYVIFTFAQWTNLELRMRMHFLEQ